MYTVYKHTTPSGKVYIGITCQKPYERWENGKGYKRNHYFYSAIKKYGWENIKHEILFSNLTKEEAEAKEIELISFYDSANKEKGYNLRQGGSLTSFSEDVIEKMRLSHIGKKLPEEQKEKISKAMRGRKVSKGNLGHKHTEETKYKMRIARIGIKYSEETKKRISESKKGQNSGAKNHKARSVINIDTGEIFDTVSQAGIKYNVDYRLISNVCRGRAKTCRGFHWKYKEMEV